MARNDGPISRLTFGAGHSPVRTNLGVCRSLSAAKPNSLADRTCARLQQQIALSTLVDDLVVASLAANVDAFREAGASDVEDFEDVIRSNRLSVLKQGAILGAIGLNV
jgi:hypothetical protein